MYNVLTLNKIAAVGTKRLGDNYTCGDDVQNPDAILVRSAAMHDMEFGENLLAIARAGAGTNNIPKDKCTEQGICVFNTPGANANAVKELVLTGLLLSSRKVVEGIEWAKTLKGTGDEMGKKVEKGKSNEEKIDVPVLFGQDNQIDKSFYADALSPDGRIVIEVEAGQATENHRFLKDIFEACMMFDVEYLVVAVLKEYSGGGVVSKDYQEVKTFLETLYISNRLKLPLKGILLIGY